MNFSESELLYKKLKSFFPDLDKSEGSIRKAVIKVLKLHPESFSNNLKRIRTNKGISQIGLSNYLGVTQTSYSAWECGTHVPRISKIDRLAELLSVDVGELFSEASFENDKELPLFRNGDFLSTSTDHFLTYKIYHSENNTKDLFNGKYQFVYLNTEDDMYGLEKVISKNSLVYCSTNEVSNTDVFDTLKRVDTKVVLLSIAGNPAVLRQIKYDGTYIRLIAWNSMIEEKICLLSEDQSLPKGKENSAMYLNHPLVISSVQIFGVAHKAVLEL